MRLSIDACESNPAPLASAVHFAYAVLKMKFPSITTRRDRRQRYGEKSSQNLFMVASHGLVGLGVDPPLAVALDRARVEVH